MRLQNSFRPCLLQNSVIQARPLYKQQTSYLHRKKEDSYDISLVGRRICQTTSVISNVNRWHFSSYIMIGGREYDSKIHPDARRFNQSTCCRRFKQLSDRRGRAGCQSWRCVFFIRHMRPLSAPAVLSRALCPVCCQSLGAVMSLDKHDALIINYASVSQSYVSVCSLTDPLTRWFTDSLTGSLTHSP